MSSSFILTEDQVIGGVNIRKGDLIMCNVTQLHHNIDQWGPDHNEFKPERFGERGRHHPMSFLPFIAGKRVCIGKTYTENTFRVVFPLFLKAFSRFEFVNADHYQKKPQSSIWQPKRPKIPIRA
jgi:cytochrome P450